MRKSFLATIVAAALLLPIGSAHAAPSNLRDPFRPLLSQEDTDPAATTDDPGPDDPITVTDPDPAPAADDGLPSTGSETTNWLAAAYMLLATGGALLVIARVTRPQRRKIGT